MGEDFVKRLDEIKTQLQKAGPEGNWWDGGGTIRNVYYEHFPFLLAESERLKNQNKHLWEANEWHQKIAREVSNVLNAQTHRVGKLERENASLRAALQPHQAKPGEGSK